MIGWLRGSLLARTGEGEVLLDVHGVGYRVTVPPRVLATASTGAQLELHVHTHVREDAIVLYGFPTLGERRTFEALLGAHGVGPALALSVLSTLGPDTLVQAVAEDDVDALCAVPGVGRKTAARLVLELKAKLQVPDVAGSPVGTGAGGAVHGDVRAALSELGYGPDEIRRALEAVPGDGRVEDVLRQALRTLAGAR